MIKPNIKSIIGNLLIVCLFLVAIFYYEYQVRVAAWLIISLMVAWQLYVTWDIQKVMWFAKFAEIEAKLKEYKDARRK